MTVADDLRAAEAVIGRRGWCQRQIVDRAGHVCAVGAVRAAVGLMPDGWTPDAWSELNTSDDVVVADRRRSDAVLQLRVWAGCSPIDWNDDEGQTEAGVRAGLLAAADVWGIEHG